MHEISNNEWLTLDISEEEELVPWEKKKKELRNELVFIGSRTRLVPLKQIIKLK